MHMIEYSSVPLILTKFSHRSGKLPRLQLALYLEANLKEAIRELFIDTGYA